MFYIGGRGCVLCQFIEPVSQEILSLGNFVVRPHFLGNSVALLHRDTLSRSTAEFDIGGETRGYWGPVPPLMSREEAASCIGNVVAALK